MFDKIKENKTITLLLLTGAVYFFLKYISPLVAPALVALLFLSACNPLFDKIRQKTNIRKNFLATAFLILFLLLLGGFLWILLSKTVSAIPGCIDGLNLVERQFCQFVENCCDGMEERFGINSTHMKTVILEKVNVFIDNFQLNILPGILNESWTYIKYAASIGGFLAVMVIATILLAKDYDNIFLKLKVHQECRMLLEVVQEVIRYIATFLKAQIIILLSISVLCVIVLTIAGIEGSILFGMLAGFLDMLPFIGTGIVLLPLGLWQLINGWYGKAAVCLILYGACGLLREMLEPRLIGQKVGVYPIAILIAVYAGIKLFGLWGILKGPLGLIMIYQSYLILFHKKQEKKEVCE